MYAQSSDGERRLKSHEGGLHIVAYQDSVKNWTVGYGTKVDRYMIITVGQAQQWYRSKVNVILEKLWEDTKTLSQCQVDALVSFIYNVGLSAWQTSHLRHLVLIGAESEVPKEMLRWDHATDPETHKLVVIDGLYARRTDEGKEFAGEVAA